MLLWDLIRDWFVQYVWGGTLSNGTSFMCFIGNFYNDNFEFAGEYTDSFFLPIGKSISGSNDIVINYITLGDWLSTTSTIIVLALMCVFLFLCVRYLFRLTSGLLMGR